MAPEPNGSRIPPLWLSDQLENQIVVGSLRAYVKILENVIAKTEEIGKKPIGYRDTSLEAIVETALESHAKIVNRRRRSEESELSSSFGSCSSTELDVEIKIPTKKPKMEPIDDYVQHQTVESNPYEQELMPSESSLELSTYKYPEPPSEYVYEHPEHPETKPKRMKSEVKPRKIAVSPRQKFTFIGTFFATTYNLQRESVALALGFIGIKIELYRVKIIPKQNSKMYSIDKKDVVRVTFEVDKKSEKKIIDMFNGDRCDMNFYEENEFGKKNKLMRGLTDTDVLKLEMLEIMAEELTDTYQKELGYRFETDEKSVSLWKNSETIWMVLADEFLLAYPAVFEKCIEKFGEEGKQKMSIYMEELKKQRNFHSFKQEPI